MPAIWRIIAEPRLIVQTLAELVCPLPKVETRSIFEALGKFLPALRCLSGRSVRAVLSLQISDRLVEFALALCKSEFVIFTVLNLYLHRGEKSAPRFMA